MFLNEDNKAARVFFCERNRIFLLLICERNRNKEWGIYNQKDDSICVEVYIQEVNILKWS